MNILSNVYRDQIVDIIKRVPFFDSLSYQEKMRLVDLKTHLFHYNPNEIIVNEGDNDRDMFVILSGTLMVKKSDIEVATLVSGDIFGEISFIAGSPRNATILAKEKSILVKINGSVYQRLSSDIKDKLKDKIIEKLIVNINKANNTIIQQRTKLDNKNENNNKEEVETIDLYM